MVQHTIIKLTRFILAIALLYPLSRIYAEKLVLFYPTTIRPKLIEKKLQEANSGLDIMVLSRYKRFITEINTNTIDAVLAKPIAVQNLDDYVISLNGLRKGVKNENFILLSIGKAIDIKSVNAHTKIGILDCMGRVGTASFMRIFFSNPPLAVRTTKMEDLLPLLTYSMASAILVPKIHQSFITKNSNINIVVTQLPSRECGIAALAIKKGFTAKKCIEAVKNMRIVIPEFIDVDSWE